MLNILAALWRNRRIKNEVAMHKIHLNFLQDSDRTLTVLVAVPVALMLVGFVIAVSAILFSH